MTEKTEKPVEAGDASGLRPEFVRVRDVERIFAIKRGTLYNLIEDGHVKSVCLRVRGKSTGLRLINLASVREYIASQEAA